MAPIFNLALFMGVLALILGAGVVLLHILDSRDTRSKVSRKRVKQLEAALSKVEDIARDSLLVNPSDLTAHQVCGVVNKTRREL